MSANPPRENVASLRRQILESALKGQQRQQVANDELNRQGEQLRLSLGAASEIALQTDDTRDVVDRLAEEAKLSKWQQAHRCLWHHLICCWRSNDDLNLNRTAVGKSHELLARLKQSSPADWTETASEKDILYCLDQLDRDKEKRRAQGQQVTDNGQSWRRTLAPPPGLAVHRAKNNNKNIYNDDIWHKQVDLSLQQLQQVAEEMGKSLDEQKRLAQTLAIYLEYGVDQVMGINDTLAIDKIN